VQRRLPVEDDAVVVLHLPLDNKAIIDNLVLRK
jgi:hypothetical protein